MKRGPTHDDRDQFVPKHRTEPRGVRIPVNLPDEITGQYEGEELREYRSRRDTHVRIERLEDHKDKSLVMFAEVNTKLGMLVDHAEKAAKREDARDRRKWILALIAGIVTGIVTLIGALR